MITAGTVLAWVIGGVVAGATGWQIGSAIKTAWRRKDADKQTQQLMRTVGADNYKEFSAYLRDATALGYIDPQTNKAALAAYTKLRSYNFDYNKLNNSEVRSLTNLYDQIYANDGAFKSYWDRQYSNMSDEDKLKIINGASTLNATIPAPAYLDTSFDRYQKEVAPLKLYSNKELAELYDLDYDYNNILKDYEAGAQADVDYSNYVSNLAGFLGERDNVTNMTSYLDSIRNVKSEAINKGISNGARAAAEVLANKEAIQNKTQANQEVALNRFELMNDSLLNRAEAALNATNVYNDLAKNLWNTGATLYANDVNRRGQDLLTNANILSADENLRSNRQAQNNLMAAMYNNYSAQNRAANGGVNNTDWLFHNVYMPAADGNLRVALSNFIGDQYSQQTRAEDTSAKWGMMSR